MPCQLWAEAPRRTSACWRGYSEKMERRRFLSACAALAGMAGVGEAPAEWVTASPRLYARSRLVDTFGAPLKASKLAARTNYVFNYPFASTPCFLLDLGRPVAGADGILRANGAQYAWTGGVGRSHSVVAYSAICAHKLAYPTREVSFIRFQADRSPTSDANGPWCTGGHGIVATCALSSAGARMVAAGPPQGCLLLGSRRGT